MIWLWAIACKNYSANDVAQEFLQSTTTVEVTHTDDWIQFTAVESTVPIGFVFYPGALVEAEAYAPVLHYIAELGIDSYALHVPLGFAVFDRDGALPIIESEPSKSWIVGGHSLGGVAAAEMVTLDERVRGLSLWASYPDDDTDLQEYELIVHSLLGSLDNIVNREVWEQSKDLLPEVTTWIDIEGGNHSQFGAYGLQEEDGVATIPANQQWQQTANSVAQIAMQIID